MNKHRKGLYIISGLFYLFFSGALAGAAVTALISFLL